MRISVLLLLMVFTFQIFDMPPQRHLPNSKTCCGRSICQCRHAKGAFCPVRHGLSEDSQKTQPDRTSAAVSSRNHKSCHLHKPVNIAEAQVLNKELPASGIVLSKAPCATDTPKSVLPGYTKDFFLDSSVHSFTLSKQGTVPFVSLHALLLLQAQRIDRPPRIF